MVVKVGSMNNMSFKAQKPEELQCQTRESLDPGKFLLGPLRLDLDCCLPEVEDSEFMLKCQDCVICYSSHGNLIQGGKLYFSC